MRYAAIGNATNDRAAEAVNMEGVIDGWMRLYRGEMPWLEETHHHTLRLPTIIASEIARMVTLEAEINVNGDGERARFLDEQFEPVRKKLRKYTEYACAGGGLMFKPYIKDNDLTVDIVQADLFYPIAYDSSGNIISAGFLERKNIGKDTYTRIEKHIHTKDGYTIKNECYKSTNGSEVGVPAPLSDVPDWKDIQAELKIEGENVPPLFAYFGIPKGNTKDQRSPLGVSVYADAIGNIRDADFLYDWFMWEFEGGQLHVEVSADAFAKDKRGQAIIPDGRERLYLVNKFTADTAGNTDLMKEFSPELRDEAFERAMNEVKQIVEYNSGLAYGTISKLQETEKTATEIRAGKQRSYSTVSDIQRALQDALEHLIAAMNALCDIYGLGGDGVPENPPAGENGARTPTAARQPYELAFVWDDSIVVDAEVERARDLEEVAQGIMNKWEYRKKWYGEDEEQAKAAIAEAEPKSNDDIMGFGGGVT